MNSHNFFMRMISRDKAVLTGHRPRKANEFAAAKPEEPKGPGPGMPGYSKTKKRAPMSRHFIVGKSTQWIERALPKLKRGYTGGQA